MLSIYVENSVGIGKKTNLILRFKKMFFYNFNISRKVESKFNIEYALMSLWCSNIFKDLKVLFICSMFS